jgi:hypothetical protein
MYCNRSNLQSFVILTDRHIDFTSLICEFPGCNRSHAIVSVKPVTLQYVHLSNIAVYPGYIGSDDFIYLCYSIKRTLYNCQQCNGRCVVEVS